MAPLKANWLNGEKVYAPDMNATAAQVNAQESNVIALTNTVKTGDPWWNTVFAAPTVDDTPTVSVATSAAVVGGTAVTPTADYFGDTHFRYDGCVSVSSVGAGLVAAVQPSGGATFPIVPEFITSQGCDKIDVLFKMNSGGTAMGVRIIVNNRWLTLPLQWFTTTASTVYYIRLRFPTAKARSIRVETTSTASFGGVVVPTGETVTRPAREVQKRMGIIGDSYAKGANSNTTTDPATNGTAVYETFVHYVAKLLGCDSVINLAVGGTGWVDDNAGADSSYGGRVPDMLAASPHIVLTVGSRNDNAYSAAQIYDAAVAALRQLADIPIVEVCGPEDDGVGSGTPSPVQNESVKQAARTAGRPFHDMIGVVTSSDKNSADTVHPSVLGAQKLAKAFYASLDRARIDETVAAAVGGRASSDLTLTASPPTVAKVGDAVTFTATLSTHRVGSVAFYANNALLGTGTVTAAVATYTSSAIAVGAYTITARFLPINPILVKPVTSNPLAYNVSTNLGFIDHFAVDGPLTATENGKAYASAGTAGTAAASGGVASITGVASGTCYRYADAGTPNGTYSVKLGGTVTGASIPLRLMDASNMLRIQVTGSQIVLNKIVANVTTALFTGSSGPWVSGETVSVVFAGDTVTVKRNGTPVTGLNGVTVPDFDTATKFGIGAASSGGSLTFDDLAFVA